MNVYDFDKTIYKNDSTLEFYKFCVSKQPTLVTYFPIQLFMFICWKLHIIKKEKFKEVFYSFLKSIKNIDQYIEEFWGKESTNIEEWYIAQQKSDDIIISASPEFLLKPICKYLSIENLIASQVNKSSGKLEGPNCYGEEKVNRLFYEFPNVIISEFYSDSISDLPLAKKASTSYLVSRKGVEKWPF